MDALYQHEQATVDPRARGDVFSQTYDIYLMEFPFIVLYSPTDLAIVCHGTHNYLPSPIVGEAINIWEWWCDNGKC